jgi:hypothetical protein
MDDPAWANRDLGRAGADIGKSVGIGNKAVVWRVKTGIDEVVLTPEESLWP